MRLNLKDRYKLLKRCFKLALTSDLESVSLVWKDTTKTSNHTFYADGSEPMDPIVETFIKVCADVKSVEVMNQFASKWILRIAERYAEANGIDKAEVYVMATPILIGVDPEQIAKEKTRSFINQSFMDPTNKHVAELLKILRQPSSWPLATTNDALNFLKKHYPEQFAKEVNQNK